MKNFLAIYTGSPDSANSQKWNSLDPNQKIQKEFEGMKAWQAWAEINKSNIIQVGGPLGKTKKVDESGVSDIRNQMAAFTIIKAESYEAAAKVFLNHPHFSVFPGDGVEIMEILPIPG